MACKREVIPPDEVELGKEYYPLAIGRFVEYDIDSTIYNDFTKDTEFVHREFRDEVVSDFLDGEGRFSYIIQRYTRISSAQPWSEYLTYYATQTNFKVEIVENNLRFIKMVLPVKLNTNWKGNVYIPAASSGSENISWYADWDYKYKNINESFFNGVKNYNNTLEVSASIGRDGLGLEGDSTLPDVYSSFTKYREFYAKNVGLIYRELTHWEYQPVIGFRNGFSVVFKAKNNN
jgi:hypothetical protein